MKVLHLIDSGGLYGAEMAVLALTSEQLASGLRPTIGVMVEHPEVLKPLESAAMERQIPARRIVVPPGMNLAGFRVVPDLIRRLAPHVLHSHGYKASILAAYSARRIAPTAVIATEHGYTATGRCSKVAVYEAIERRMLRRIHGVAVVSTMLRQKLMECGIAAERIHLIYNGLPLDEKLERPLRDDEREMVSFCRCGPTILAVGRLEPEKDFGTLISAVGVLRASIPNIQLLILGEGSQRADLTNRIAGLGLQSQVRMPGYVPAIRILHAVAVLAMTSTTEGLPMTLLEAMRARVPIVTTVVGGIGELLGCDPVAFVADVGSAESVATALSCALRGDDAVQSRVRSAETRFKEAFSSSRMATAYEMAYRHARAVAAGGSS